VAGSLVQIQKKLRKSQAGSLCHGEKKTAAKLEGWKYTVEGRTVDGDQASCSVAIEGHLIIITVIA